MPDSTPPRRVQAIVGLRLLEMICLVTHFAGGFGLLACGLGLQSERRNSGRLAMCITLVPAGLWWLSGAGFLWAGPAWGRAGGAFVLAVLWTSMLGMAHNSNRLLRLYPPPPDPEVTKELLAELRHRRHDYD